MRSTLPGAASASASPPESDVLLVATLWTAAGLPFPRCVSGVLPRCRPPLAGRMCYLPKGCHRLCHRGARVAPTWPAKPLAGSPALCRLHALGSSRLWSHKHLRLIPDFFLPRSPHQSFLRGVLENMTQYARRCRGVTADTAVCLGYPAPVHAGCFRSPCPLCNCSVTVRSPRPPSRPFAFVSPQPPLKRASFSLTHRLIEKCVF